MRVEKEYKCLACGNVQVAEPWAEPQHCGFRMAEGAILFKGGDPNRLNVSMVEIPKDKVSALINFETRTLLNLDPSWEPAFEVWFMKPGRKDGERIGWCGKTLLGWGYQMVDGVSSISKEGVAPTRDGVIERMLLALAD